MAGRSSSPNRPAMAASPGAWSTCALPVTAASSTACHLGPDALGACGGGLGQPPGRALAQVQERFLSCRPRPGTRLARAVAARMIRVMLIADPRVTRRRQQVPGDLGQAAAYPGDDDQLAAVDPAPHPVPGMAGRGGVPHRSEPDGLVVVDQTVTRRLSPAEPTEYRPLFDKREEAPHPDRRTPGPHPRNHRGRQPPETVSPAEPGRQPPESVVTARLTCGHPPARPRFPRSALNVKTSPL